MVAEQRAPVAVRADALRGVRRRQPVRYGETHAATGVPHAVADVMTWPAPAVGPDATAGLAVARMRARGCAHALIVAGRVPIGLLCGHDLEQLPSRVRAFEVLQRVPLVTALDVPEHAAFLLRAADACALPVVVTGQCSGLVSREDLLGAGVGGSWPRCAACHGVHRVRGGGPDEAAFCEPCLQTTNPFDFDDLYVDLGCGD